MFYSCADVNPMSMMSLYSTVWDLASGCEPLSDSHSVSDRPGPSRPAAARAKPKGGNTPKRKGAKGPYRDSARVMVWVTKAARPVGRDQVPSDQAAATRERVGTGEALGTTLETLRLSGRWRAMQFAT